MNMSDMCLLFNYLRHRLNTENPSDLFKKRPTYTGTSVFSISNKEKGGMEWLCFNLEPKFDQALSLLIIGWYNHLPWERQARIADIFDYNRFDSLFDPKYHTLIRLPYNWSVRKHNYFVNIDETARKLKIVKMLKRAVNAFMVINTMFKEAQRLNKQ